jgi:hypothetical protein
VSWTTPSSTTSPPGCKGAVWARTRRGTSPRAISQTALIVNPAGGLGPRIFAIAPLSQRIVANVGTVNIVCSTSAAHVAFYRIYRGGEDARHEDRYDQTTGGLVTLYTDSGAGSTSHRYWVTTVDSKFNESDPIGPVTWTP